MIIRVSNHADRIRLIAVKNEGRFRKRRRPSSFPVRITPEHFIIVLTPMPPELPPDEDRPGVPIAPPLLFVLPILASLAVEWFAPTSFAQGACRWIMDVL